VHLSAVVFSPTVRARLAVLLFFVDGSWEPLLLTGASSFAQRHALRASLLLLACSGGYRTGRAVQ
jgi:hypothetical protein